MARTHTVESTPETVRSGYLDPAAEPVATVAPGDTVSYPHTWTHWGNEAVYGMSFAEREPLRHRYPHGPYSMLGPVAVTGAEPGDVIEVSITRLRTIDWGWNSFPLGVGALPHDFAQPYLHCFRFDGARTTAEFVHVMTAALDDVPGKQKRSRRLRSRRSRNYPRRPGAGPVADGPGALLKQLTKTAL